MRTLVILFVISILAIIILIPLILLSYLTKLSRPIITVGKFGIYLSQKIAGIGLDVYGIEKVDRKSSYVFMANHMSIIDGPLLFMLIPHPVRVLLKKEAFKIPIISQAMREVGFIPVDRKGLKGGKQSIDKASRLMREKGYSFLIFPEGTRSRNGLLQVFKRGGFFMAINSQVPIIPISIKGTFKLMPRGSFFIKKGRIKVVFHDPVPVQGYNLKSLWELSDKVKGIIQSGLA